MIFVRTGQALLSAKFAIAATLLLGAGAGCGSQTGPERAEVSGYVTFKGEPVPTGVVEYKPNVEKGASGPGVMLVIRDGYYESDGKGPVFGHQIVKVSGYTGEPLPFQQSGEQLFPTHKEEVEITEASYEINYDFPLAGQE